MSGGGADGPSWEVGLISLGTSTYSYTPGFLFCFFISALQSVLSYVISSVCSLDGRRRGM